MNRSEKLFWIIVNSLILVICVIFLPVPQRPLIEPPNEMRGQVVEVDAFAEFKEGVALLKMGILRSS